MLGAKQIAPGDSLPFVFCAPPVSVPPEGEAWACEIHVVPYRGATSEITPRAITPAADGTFAGTLTPAETGGLVAKDYFLVAVYTATGLRVEESLRFRVRPGWVA